MTALSHDQLATVAKRIRAAGSACGFDLAKAETYSLKGTDGVSLRLEIEIKPNGTTPLNRGHVMSVAWEDDDWPSNPTAFSAMVNEACEALSEWAQHRLNMIEREKVT